MSREKYTHASFLRTEVESGFADRCIKIHRKLYDFCVKNNLLFHPPVNGITIYIENVKSPDMLDELVGLNLYKNVDYSMDIDCIRIGEKNEKY